MNILRTNYFDFWNKIIKTMEVSFIHICSNPPKKRDKIIELYSRTLYRQNIKFDLLKSQKIKLALLDSIKYCSIFWRVFCTFGVAIMRYSNNIIRASIWVSVTEQNVL